MLSSLRTRYEHTIHACYLGYITQAVVNSYLPLLFLHFQSVFHLSLAQITLITTLNFAIQLCIDFLSTFFVDRIGYRKCVCAAHLFACTGLAGLSVLPYVFPRPYPGILTCVVLYAIGGGLIEVLISPIVESCPTEKKEAAMSLLHSFYCWGVMGMTLLSTLFFHVFGIRSWRILSCIWALIPAFTFFLFLQVPIFPVVAENQEKLSIRSLIGSKVFWLLLGMMICAGASEQAMSQWASAFAESGLHISKTLGDLAGPCAFALTMGTARAIFGNSGSRLSLKKGIAGSALLCIVCYALAVFSASPVLALIGCALCGFSVGIFWPGTFSMAAKALPGGGTPMYALLALAGDIGCSGGPTLVGLVSNANGGVLTTGLLAAMVFPVLMILFLLLLVRSARV